MAEPKKNDWKEYVAKMNGNSLFLPEQFRAEQEKIEEKRKEFNKKAIDIAKDDILLNMEQQNLYLAVRKFLEQNGHPDIWVKNIGYHAGALQQDHEFIVNITEGRSQ